MQPYRHTIWLAPTAMVMGYPFQAGLLFGIGFVFSLFDTTRKRF